MIICPILNKPESHPSPTTTVPPLEREGSVSEERERSRSGQEEGKGGALQPNPHDVNQKGL